MTDQAERSDRARRNRWWPAAVLGVVGVLLTLWLMRSLEWVVGVEPIGRLDRTGVAQVQQCERHPLELWMTYWCKAEVHWDEVPQGQDLVSTTTIMSVSELSGTVPVERYRYTTTSRHNGISKVVYSTAPVDRPLWPINQGWWEVFTFVSVIPGYIAGFFVGGRLELLMPEVKEKPKNWRGVNRRRTSGMNGPRRYKRKRG